MFSLKPAESCDICELNVDFHPVGSYNADADGNYCDVGNFCFVNSGYTCSDPPSYRESPSPMPRNQVQRPIFYLARGSEIGPPGVN
jgi:hypothetical protein